MVLDSAEDRLRDRADIELVVAAKPGVAPHNSPSNARGYEFVEILRQWAGPFTVAFDCKARRVQGMSRKEQLTFELRGPSGLNKMEVKLFVRSVNFVAHNGMTNRGEVHSNLVRASCVWNRAV